MQPSNRDPRRDPKPGDVVETADWQYHVRDFDGDSVVYGDVWFQHGKLMELRCGSTIEKWRSKTKGAEIIHAAE